MTSSRVYPAWYQWHLICRPVPLARLPIIGLVRYTALRCIARQEEDAGCIPVVAALARSSLSTSSSLRTASLPCLRIQLANLGSDASVASANSLSRHSGLWNGQYACAGSLELVFSPGGSSCYMWKSTLFRKLPSGTWLSRKRLIGIDCIEVGPWCCRSCCSPPAVVHPSSASLLFRF